MVDEIRSISESLSFCYFAYQNRNAIISEDLLAKSVIISNQNCNLCSFDYKQFVDGINTVQKDILEAADRTGVIIRKLFAQC